MNINEYRAQFAAYNASLELARYQHQVGSEPEFKIDRVRADYSDLFTLAALTDLQSHLDTTRADAASEGAAVRVLLHAARLEHVEIQSREALRELVGCESSTRLEWCGERVSPESISYRLSTEPQKARRNELARLWTKAVAACDELRFARLHRLHNAAAKLGFDSYGDLIAEATRTNLSQVQLDAEGLLQQTEAVHRLALSSLAQRSLPAVSASELHFADLAYLERVPWLDEFFSAQNWATTYADMMVGLGIRVDKQPNIQIAPAGSSLRDRPAMCFPVNPPRDVRLACSSRRGAYDFAATLYAASLAQQHAWCSRDLAEGHPEYVYSKDSATREGYAYLFSFLLLDARWIQEFLQPISEAQANALAHDLTSLLTLQVRRLAAETSYAILLHSVAQPSAEQLQAAFLELHDRATGIRFSPELFLFNLHERINGASRLRALTFAAGLREYLRVRHGNRWWASRKAGDELIDLWNTASRHSVEDLARLIGFGEISLDLITELLTETKSGA